MIIDLAQEISELKKTSNTISKVSNDRGLTLSFKIRENESDSVLANFPWN